MLPLQYVDMNPIELLDLAIQIRSLRLARLARQQPLKE